MSARRHFLWPDPQPFGAGDLLGPQLGSALVEERLRAIYPGADPVLFSSARAGLTAVLQAKGLSRPDRVWCPAYSSHCVLEAIAHVATPTTGADTAGEAPVAAALVYHQWGHVHRAGWDASVRLIEDAVDSLPLPGSDPIRLAADHSLLSLPKVLATQGGGVVFCRHRADADALRGIRDQRGASGLQAWLRWRSHANARAAIYWNGAEALQGGVSPAPLRQILRALAVVDAVVEGRLALLGHLSAELRAAAERSGRLPANLPLRPPAEWARVWGPDGVASAGLRHFNAARCAPHAEWVRVAPLPVHVGVSIADIDHIRLTLNPEGLFDEFDLV
jgi:putative PLP-dependent aminotransferase (TIGR04422 family)